MVYGFDKALGYYFDVYPGPDDLEKLVEQHSWFTGMTGAKMMDEFGKHGARCRRNTGTPRPGTTHSKFP